MQKKETDLSSFNNTWFNAGASRLKQICWYFVSIVLFKSGFPFNTLKVHILRLFGAQIGKGLVLKPYVNIKFPWKLFIGNDVWIGENVWIDNLDVVTLEDHVCVSQGAMLLCGNHNYKKTSFDLLTGKIILKKGSWIGAQAVVCPGIEVGSHAILTVASVATKNLKEFTIYQGNPAQAIKEREIN